MDGEFSSGAIPEITNIPVGPDHSPAVGSRLNIRHRLGGLIPENSILAALPRDVYARLSDHLKPVSYSAGAMLDLSTDPFTYLVFPHSCVVSLVREMPDGASPEIALVGSEGVAGIEFFLGGNSQLCRGIVRIPGTAVRIAASALRKEFELSGALQSMLLRYTQAFIAQTAQAAVCKRLHSIEHDVCRWLLQLHDRSNTDHLPATHELIAAALGVRREGVTVAVGRLHAAKLIHRIRGQVSIINRIGLEQHACDCYRLVREQYDQILGGSLGQKRWLNSHAAGLR